jgi:hypothetical protein
MSGGFNPGMYGRPGRGLPRITSPSGLGGATPVPEADDVVFTGHSGTNVDDALDARRPTHVSASDPTATDDDGDGHIVGCHWVNTTSNEEFVAVDVSTGAAIWESTTAGGGGGSLTVEDADESYGPVDTLVFAASGDASVDIADDGGGQVTVTIGATGGGGGGGSGARYPVQEKAASHTSTNSLGVTLGAAPTNGNVLILISECEGSSNITGITQTNVTWTKLAESTASTSPHTEIWKGVASASAGTGITVAYSASNWSGYVVSEWSGLTGTLDQTAASTNTGRSTGYLPAITPTSSTALVVFGATDTTFGAGFTAFGSPQLILFSVSALGNGGFYAMGFGFPGTTSPIGSLGNSHGGSLSMVIASIT